MHSPHIDSISHSRRSFFFFAPHPTSVHRAEAPPCRGAITACLPAAGSTAPRLRHMRRRCHQPFQLLGGAHHYLAPSRQSSSSSRPTVVSSPLASVKQRLTFFVSLPLLEEAKCSRKSGCSYTRVA